ncbi:MATE family efflux transporter [Devosia sp.]|uniref:MATE family efflux transporter n=1 Tax=Devosia sp. TaxID=1871048 RepID=UPI002EEAF1EA
MSRPVYPFDVRSQDIWRIALPASLAFITEPLAGLVDITVIGRLGEAALLGGLVIGALVFDFIFSLAFFLRTGTAGLTAQAIGARDSRDGLLHVGRAIALGAGIGVVMIALTAPLLWLATLAMAPAPGVAAALEDYFAVRIWSAPFSLVNYALLGWFYGRAAAGTGMVLQLIIHGVNIALSIGFVYGLGWGIPGVALGTVLGQAAACLAGLALLVRHFGGARRMAALLVPRDLLDASALRRMFGLSRDLMIRSMALMGAYGWFAAQGSRMGEVPLAANAILLNFLMISGFFLDGLAQASEQLCGKAVGANWRPAFERAYALSFRWGALLAAALGLAWFASGWMLIDFMTTSEAVRLYAREFLWLAALSALTGMPAFVYDGILIGITLNTVMRDGMLIALGVFLAAAVLLQPPLGNTGLWVAIHVFFLARAGVYWWGLERRKAALFAP